jgi:hypothetical protein
MGQLKRDVEKMATRWGCEVDELIKQYKTNKAFGLSESLPKVWKKGSKGELISPDSINEFRKRNGAL